MARDGPVGGQVPPNPPTRARAHTNILAVAWCRDDDVVPQNLIIIIVTIIIIIIIVVVDIIIIILSAPGPSRGTRRRR